MTLEEATAPRDLSNYRPVPPAATPPLVLRDSGWPGFNPMIRCPLPPVAVTPDTLRQFYRNGEVPQVRIMTPSL